MCTSFPVSGTVCYFECRYGFLGNGGTTNILCGNDGKWSKNESSILKCLGKGFVKHMSQDMGSRVGAVLRELASHQYVPGSIPRLGVICGLSLSLVLHSASRGFSPGTPVFPFPHKPIWIWIIVKHFIISPWLGDSAITPCD